MILAFAHPCLVVSDLEAAKRFYQDMFGFKVISVEGWSNNPQADRAVGVTGSRCKGYMLAGHNCFLELFEYQAPEQTAKTPEKLGPQEQGIRHLAFYVDDCQQEFERFLSLGGSPLGTPTADEHGNHAVYCRDPFGNIIELSEIPTQQENPTQLPGIESLGDFKG